MRQIIREGDPEVWGTNSFKDARGVKDIQLLDGGKRIIVSENYGDIAPCLAIYKAESLERESAWVLPEESVIPNSIAIVEDPKRIVIDIYDHICGINLESKSIFGEPIKLFFHAAPNNWRSLFKDKKRFKVARLSVFDNGKLLVVHCGMDAPALPSNLLSLNLPSFEIVKNPIYTLNIKNKYHNFFNGNKVGIADKKKERFITIETGSIVKVWDIRTLSLIQELKLDLSSHNDITQYENHKNRLHLPAICEIRDWLAIGTFHGSVYIIDQNNGETLLPPLIPEDRNYSIEKKYYDQKEENEISALSFFLGGNRLLVGYADGSLYLWNTTNGKLITNWAQLSDSRINKIFVLNDKKVILALEKKNNYDPNIHVLDLSKLL